MTGRLEKSCVLLLLTTLLISCKDTTNLAPEDLPSGEVFISKSYSKKSGIVTGSRNLYVVYGRLPTGEVAGTALAPTKKFAYRIKDLLDKWRQNIEDPRIMKAIEKQEKELATLRK